MQISSVDYFPYFNSFYIFYYALVIKIYRYHPFGHFTIKYIGLNDNGSIWWEYDTLGGQIKNNGQNALLSYDTKVEIYKKHMLNPKKWSIERLSKEYRIRQQRVMAIIALKVYNISF